MSTLVKKNGFTFKRRESAKENVTAVVSKAEVRPSHGGDKSGVGVSKSFPADVDDDDEDFQTPTPKKTASAGVPRKAHENSASQSLKKASAIQNKSSSSSSSGKSSQKSLAGKTNNATRQQPSITGFIVKSQENNSQSARECSTKNPTDGRSFSPDVIPRHNTSTFSKPVAKVKPQISPTDAQRSFDVRPKESTPATRNDNLAKPPNNSSSNRTKSSSRPFVDDDEDSVDRLFDDDDVVPLPSASVPKQRGQKEQRPSRAPREAVLSSPPLDIDGLDDPEILDMLRGIETQHENPLFSGDSKMVEDVSEDANALVQDEDEEEEERRMLREMARQREMSMPDDFPEEEEEDFDDLDDDDDEEMRPLKERMNDTRASSFRKDSYIENEEEEETLIDDNFTEDDEFVPDDVFNGASQKRDDHAPPSSPNIVDPSQFDDVASAAKPRRRSSAGNGAVAPSGSGKKPLFRSPEKGNHATNVSNASSSSSAPSKVEMFMKYFDSLRKIVHQLDEASDDAVVKLPDSIKIEMRKNNALKKRLGSEFDVRRLIEESGESHSQSRSFSRMASESGDVAGNSASTTTTTSSQSEVVVRTKKKTTKPFVFSSDEEDLFDDEIETSQSSQSTKNTIKTAPSSKHKFAITPSRNKNDDGCDRIDLTLDCSQTQLPSQRVAESAKKLKKSAPVLGLPSPAKKGASARASSSSSGASSNIPTKSSSAYVTPETPPDDGPEFNSETYPHSAKLREIFRNTFGLKTFRKNQLSAINAALLGHDTFVLMPTGGGKSLCYQLPALVRDGVTVVLSPLKSLIQDQVDRLKEHRIRADFLSSDLTPAQQDQVYYQLQLKTIEIKLLYITPEKLCSSGRLATVLENLYRRSLLTMFVIDEAHCVSQWGHDFRPDYKKLSSLREQYPTTPIMALTATATMRVRTDVLNQLRILKAKKFVQSFNRTNLRYKVMEKKPKSITEQVINTVRTDFSRKSGIVYCLSRKECDTLAKALKAAGIRAEAYHAGLTDNQRVTVQRRWVRDEILVVCATIAFGMGIDKADVRFVIHFSLPKSIEGYYQESGRAGRDGDEATCILFYNYHDVIRMRRIIEMDNPNHEAVKNHLNNLYRMVAYANDTVDCRRVIQLQYFGENNFTDDFCKKVGPACDNCGDTTKCVQIDATDKAKAIVLAVKRIASGRGGKVTLAYLADVAKGACTQKIEQMGHKSEQFAHGIIKDWKKADVERLMRHLVINGYLMEQISITMHDSAVAYVSCGPKAGALFNDGSQADKILFSLRGSAPILSKSASSTAADGDRSVDRDEDLRQECYNQLLQLVKSMAQDHNKSSYGIIYTNESLREMARRLPTDENEFRKITAVTEAKVATYGSAPFLEITQDFASAVAVRNVQRQDEEEANSQAEFNAMGDSDDDLENFGNTSAHFSRGRGGGGGWKNYKGKGRGGFKNKYAKGGYKRKRAAGSGQGGGGAKRQRTSSASRGTQSRSRAGSATSSRGRQTVSADGYLSAKPRGGGSGGRTTGGGVGLLAPPAPMSRRPDLGL